MQNPIMFDLDRHGTVPPSLLRHTTAIASQHGAVQINPDKLPRSPGPPPYARLKEIEPYMLLRLC